MLIFYAAFLPLFMVSLIVPAIIAGLRHRARLQQERARHDQQRFLRIGFLREQAREDEQRSTFANFLRMRAK